MDELIQCKTCKYYDPANMLARCILCRPEMKDWEPKDRNQATQCETCRHEEKSAFREPCISCGIAWPGSSSHWEPKEQKEENMENENRNTTATIDTEAELKAQVAKLQEELEEADGKLNKLVDELHSREMELAHKIGMVEGLKFAIRCSGVSGGEV